MKLVDPNELLGHVLGRANSLSGLRSQPWARELGEEIYPLLEHILQHLVSVEEELEELEELEGGGPYIPAEEADKIATALKSCVDLLGGIDHLPDELKAKVVTATAVLGELREEDDEPEEPQPENGAAS